MYKCLLEMLSFVITLQENMKSYQQNLFMTLKSISVMSSLNFQPTLREKNVITLKASLSAPLLVKRNSVAVIIVLQLSLWLNIWEVHKIIVFQIFIPQVMSQLLSANLKVLLVNNKSYMQLVQSQPPLHVNTKHNLLHNY